MMSYIATFRFKAFFIVFPMALVLGVAADAESKAKCFHARFWTWITRRIFCYCGDHGTAVMYPAYGFCTRDTTCWIFLFIITVIRSSKPKTINNTIRSKGFYIVRQISSAVEPLAPGKPLLVDEDEVRLFRGIEDEAEQQKMATTISISSILIFVQFVHFQCSKCFSCTNISSITQTSGGCWILIPTTRGFYFKWKDERAADESYDAGW